VIDVPPGSTIDDDMIAAVLAPIVPADELAATSQDAAFHAEGDVWTHTKLAMRALVEGELYAALSPIGRRVVATAVLLHDIGKPATTRDDGGKLTSRGHSAKGESLARAAMWRLDVPFAFREHVCALVRHHQIPFFGIDKPADEAARLARMLSLVLRHDWLVAVADADARGRRCARDDDQTRIIDHCALWAELTRDFAIFDRPQAFASSHTRRVWCESPTRPYDVRAHDDTTCEVIAMVGMPASGKDTWLGTHRPDLPVIALDQLRADLEVEPEDGQGEVIAAARERARGYLRAGTSFAWNATNLSRQLRAQLLELFRSYRARTHLVYCEATVAQQLERNRARRDPVPRAAIARMIDRWSVPDPSEAHELTYVVAASDEPLHWPPVATLEQA
jgi:predicted kinase